MELKTEALFIYGCYAPETEVGCRARATYLPAAFTPRSLSFLRFSLSLCLFYFYATLREYCYVPIADIVLKQGETSMGCTLQA